VPLLGVAAVVRHDRHRAKQRSPGPRRGRGGCSRGRPVCDEGIGVFGGVLVPGLLLLGVEPRVAAPLSLLLQVIVIPLGATSHAAIGNVQRSIAVPLIVGGVIAASPARSSPRPCRRRGRPEPSPP